MSKQANKTPNSNAETKAGADVASGIVHPKVNTNPSSSVGGAANGLISGPAKNDNGVADAINDAITAMAASPSSARANAYGPCKMYIPDNSKALLGPKLAPALMEAGFGIHMPKVNGPTLKAPKERFYGTVKDGLRQLPLPVVDMIRAREMNYDVGKHAIILSQLRDLVGQLVIHHNAAPTTELGGRSPNDIIAQQDAREARNMFFDMERAERKIMLTDQAMLDRNGVEFNGLRYRLKDVVKALLDSMQNLGPSRVTKRANKFIAIIVKIRINPGNIEKIQVFDDVRKAWFELPSTEPEYTHLLSASEHKIFIKRARQRNEVIKNKAQRLASMARTRDEMAKLVPNLQFQQRREWANLFENKAVQERTKRTYAAPDPDGPFLDVFVHDTERADTGLPGGAEYSAQKAENNSGVTMFDVDSEERHALDELDLGADLDNYDFDRDPDGLAIYPASGSERYEDLEKDDSDNDPDDDVDFDTVPDIEDEDEGRA